MTRKLVNMTLLFLASKSGILLLLASIFLILSVSFLIAFVGLLLEFVWNALGPLVGVMAFFAFLFLGWRLLFLIFVPLFLIADFVFFFSGASQILGVAPFYFRRRLRQNLHDIEGGEHDNKSP